MSNISLAKFVPHRDRMLLIDQILEVDESRAATMATVTETWPLLCNGTASSLVSIELVAQTASVYIGWNENQKNDQQECGRGWLVGIKHAVFRVDRFPVQRDIITRVQSDFIYEDYTGIQGSVAMEGQLIANIRLQVMRSKSNSVIYP